jgi:hypothetical protein
MNTLRAQLTMSLPVALSCWLAQTGSRGKAAECATILMFHGTPRAQAAELER